MWPPSPVQLEAKQAEATDWTPIQELPWGKHCEIPKVTGLLTSMRFSDLNRSVSDAPARRVEDTPSPLKARRFCEFQVDDVGLEDLFEHARRMVGDDDLRHDCIWQIL